jgi:signal transduction histidine kinase
VNRLATRLALAMAGVVAIAIVLVVAAQFALLRQQYAALPEAVRSEVDTIVTQHRVPDEQRLARLERAFLTWLEDPVAREAVVEALLATRRPGAQVGFLLAALAATAIAVVVGILVAGRIARPIAAVARAAERVTAGDLGARAALEGVRAPGGRRRPAAAEVETLAAAFDDMTRSLERLERERKALIADVAHELRTPLAVLQGRLEAMIDGVLPVDTPELERLHRQTGQLTQLVEDLRLLSLADADRLVLRLDDVDLVPWGREVVAGFEAVAAERGVRLTQVLSNLLDNAIGVTTADGAVEVEVGFTGDGARIVVRDGGPGLPPGALERVFERFYRTPAATASHARGSGLGLAIVRSLVEAHGGRVAASNRARGGAQVEVSLPTQAPHGADRPTSG